MLHFRVALTFFSVFITCATSFGDFGGQEPTPQEIETCYKMFKEKIKSMDPETTGTSIFKWMFNKNPRSRKVFKGSSDDETFFSSPRFQRHSRKMVKTFGRILDHLKNGNPTGAEKILQKLAGIHKEEKMKPYMAAWIVDSMMHVLPTMTDSEKVSWAHLLHHIFWKRFRKILAEEWNKPFQR